MNRIVTALIFVSLTASSASGQARVFDPAARAKEIAPFIDDQTIIVGHVDLTRINVKAGFAVIDKIVKLDGGHDMKEIDAGRVRAEKLATTFLADMATAGATDAYMIISIADIPSEPLFVVPLKPGANERAIQGLLYSGRADGPTSRPKDTEGRRRNPLQVKTIRGAVVRCDSRVLQRIKSMEPHPLSELAKAFVTAGNTTAQLLVVPTADSRRVIEAMMPNLPAQLGGGSIKTLTRGAMWIAIGADGPPEMSLLMHIQSQNAASAKVLGELIPKAVDWALSEADKSDELREMLPDLKLILALLLPDVQGDHLTLQMDNKQTEKVVLSDLLTPLLRKSRQSAKRVKSMGNLKDFGTAFVVYNNNNKGAFPASLDVLVEKKLLRAEQLISPISGKKAYVYIRPPAGEKVYAQTVVVYEDPATHKLDKTCVLFADAHVGFIKVDKQFHDMIKKARAASAKAP